MNGRFMCAEESIRAPVVCTASSRWPRSSAAKASSRTNTLASRASSRLIGSRFDEPTVAIAPCGPSNTATLACRKLGSYSMISMPAASSTPYIARLVWCCMKYS